MFLLAGVAALSLFYVWRGGTRMMKMQTSAANSTQFAQLKPQDATAIVIEAKDVSAIRIGGTLLQKRDETHYTHTAIPCKVQWDPQTKIVMGKAEDIRAGAVLHVVGKVLADHSVQASQIVILTGYVQVK